MLFWNRYRVDKCTHPRDIQIWLIAPDKGNSSAEYGFILNNAIKPLFKGFASIKISPFSQVGTIHILSIPIQGRIGCFEYEITPPVKHFKVHAVYKAVNDRNKEIILIIVIRRERIW